ncbi:TolC family protein [Thermopirellula anaerolimosa]
MADSTSQHIKCLTTLGIALAVCVIGATLGCHRTAYRRTADAEVAQLIERGQVDSRWDLMKTGIYPRRESRMYDPFCPDAEPMPPDDPVSHELMHCVDGKKGWPHWHDDGDTFYVENPFWRAYLPRDDRGVVVLDRSKAVDLALVHSRDYQRNLENLYLSALNVTAERFRFDVQFFGGNSTFFTADGPDRSPAGSISRLNVDTDVQARKLTATGAELLVGFANSLVWQFSGADSYASASILNFSILQPLLRSGGRAVVLESLTQAERALLANIRQMARYQKGFYLQVVTGTSPGTGPSSGNLTIGSLSPQVSAGRGGVLGLLQSQVQIRNQEQNVLGLQGVYELLLAAHEADRIDRFQVDLALQSLLNAQNRLLSLRSAYETQLDAFKVQLGLPPEVAMEIDDPLLRRFDLIDPELLTAQREANELLRQLRDPDTPLPPDWTDHLRSLQESIKQQVEIVKGDLERLAAAVPQREQNIRELYSGPDSVLAGGVDAERAIEELRSRFKTVVENYRLLLEGSVPGVRGEVRAERKPMQETLQQMQEFLDHPEEVAQRLVTELETATAQLRTESEKAAAEVQRLEKQLESAEEAELPLLEQQYIDARVQAQTAADRLAEKEKELEAAKAQPRQILASDLLEPLIIQLSDLSLIQVRARLDQVSLTPVTLSPEEALEIARRNRLDWMNARAALVDQWRQIQIAANRLRSDLDVTFSGDMQTIGDNPFGFHSTTGELRVGFRFDAPLTRLVERNQYRAALISYQRARRDYYAFEDQISQSLRDTLRNIRLSQNTFELRRSSVLVAIAQSDVAGERLRAPPQPGETPRFGATTARDVVQALSGLLDAQNAFLAAWVEYEVQRMSLDFQLDTMQLDDRGLWIDPGPIRGGPFVPEENPGAAQPQVPPAELPNFPATTTNPTAGEETARPIAMTGEGTQNLRGTTETQEASPTLRKLADRIQKARGGLPPALAVSARPGPNSDAATTPVAPPTSPSSVIPVSGHEGLPGGDTSGQWAKDGETHDPAKLPDQLLPPIGMLLDAQEDPADAVFVSP